MTSEAYIVRTADLYGTDHNILSGQRDVSYKERLAFDEPFDLH